jgi:hypothetical protein
LRVQVLLADEAGGIMEGLVTNFCVICGAHGQKRQVGGSIASDAEKLAKPFAL